MATILIVDDDAMVRQILETLLETATYTTVSARNGQEALLLVRAIRPTVIVLDIEMPIMNGAETLALLKAQADLAHIPVIGMTSHLSGATQLREFAKHNIPYFTKPLDFPALLQAIKEYSAG